MSSSLTQYYFVFADSFQHQQQVLTAVERAKQVSMSELNAIIGVSATSQLQCGRMDGRTNGLEGEGGKTRESHLVAMRVSCFPLFSPFPFLSVGNKKICADCRRPQEWNGTRQKMVKY